MSTSHGTHPSTMLMMVSTEMFILLQQRMHRKPNNNKNGYHGNHNQLPHCILHVAYSKTGYHGNLRTNQGRKEERKKRRKGEEEGRKEGKKEGRGGREVRVEGERGREGKEEERKERQAGEGKEGRMEEKREEGGKEGG